MMYADLAIKGFDSKNPTAYVTAALLAGATMAYMNRRFGRSGWAGFGKGLLIGIPSALLTLFAHSAVSGFVRRLDDRRIVDRLATAAAHFEPTLGAGMQSSGASGTTAMSAAEREEKLGSALRKAIQVAPDAALLEFQRAIVDVVDPSKGGTVSSCAELARGNGERVATLDSRRWIQMITTLLESADRGPRRLETIDGTQAGEALSRILQEVDADNVLSDASKLASTSDGDLCARYLSVSRRIQSLPSTSAAGVYRYISQSKLTQAAPVGDR